MIIVTTVIRLIVFGYPRLREHPNAIRFLGLMNFVQPQSWKASSMQANSMRVSG